MSCPLPNHVTDNGHLRGSAIRDHSSHTQHAESCHISTVEIHLQCAINLKRFRQFANGPDLKAFTSRNHAMSYISSSLDSFGAWLAKCLKRLKLVSLVWGLIWSVFADLLLVAIGCTPASHNQASCFRRRPERGCASSRLGHCWTGGGESLYKANRQAIHHNFSLHFLGTRGGRAGGRLDHGSRPFSGRLR